MAEGSRRDDWFRTSSEMALLANINRDPKKHRSYEPGDFDPFVVARKAKPIKADITVLRDVFIDRKMPKF